MKRYLFLCFFMFSIQLQGQIAESLFDIGFGPISHQLVRTNDHGYIVVLTNYGFNGYGANRMIKIDSVGNVAWARNYTGGFHCAALIGENKFAVYGFQDSITWPAIIYNTQLSVYDSNGFFESAVTLPESLVVRKMHPTSDGGTIAIPENGSLMMKTDSTGNFEWIKFIDSINSPRVLLADIIESKSGGFIGLSNYIYPDTINSPLYTLVVRLNSSGDTIWTRSYENVFGHSIFNAFGNNYIILGDGDWQQGFSSTISMLDSAGNIYWTKSVPFGYWINDFSITLDQQFVYSGFEFASSPMPFLLKTDTSGSILWMRKYPGGYNYKTFVTSGPDTGFVLASTGYDEQALIIFTDSTGASACDSLATPILLSTISIANTLPYRSVHIASYLPPPYPSSSFPLLIDSVYFQADNCILLYNNFESEKNPIEIYPNPATNQFAVSSLQFSNAELEVYNLLGEKMFSDRLNSGGQLTVDCRLFPRGIYFVRLSNSKFSRTEKLIKE